MDKKLKSIFQKVYSEKQSEEFEQKVGQLKELEKKVFLLLAIVRETKKADKILSEYDDVQMLSPKAIQLKQRHDETELKSRNMWIDIMMQIQDNNNGVELLSNSGYFQVLEILQSMMCQITAKSRVIVDIQDPTHSPRDDEEEEKVPEGGRGRSYDSEEFLSQQVENLRREVQELSREVELSREISLSKQQKKRNKSQSHKIIDIDERVEENDDDKIRDLND